MRHQWPQQQRPVISNKGPETILPAVFRPFPNPAFLAGKAFLSSPGAGSDWETEARPSLGPPGRFSCTGPSACLPRSLARMWERWESPLKRRCCRGDEQEAGAHLGPRLWSSGTKATHSQRALDLRCTRGQKSRRGGWRRCWRLGSVPVGLALGFS